MYSPLSLLLPLSSRVSLMQPQQQHRQLLSRLSVEQLEEALMCLHLDLLPKDKLLRKLPSQDWNLLHELLVMLFREKEQSSLH